MHTVGVHHVCHDIGRRYGSLFRLTSKVIGHYQWDFFTTLFQQILTVIKHVADDNFVFSRTVHRHIMHATHSNCRRANSQFQFSSVLLIITFSLKAQQWSPLNIRFRDSHISTSISCQSTRLKKSSSDWLKSREVEYSIRVKNAIFVFFYFTR